MPSRKTARKTDKPPGCIYVKDGRWYWRGRLPGSAKYVARAVKPEGASFALPADPENLQAAYAVVWRWLSEAQPDGQCLTVADLAGLYLDHARTYYRHADGTPTGEADGIEYGLRMLVADYGSRPAESIGRAELHALRRKMIDADLARSTINKRLGMIKRMYHWAADEGGHIPASVYGSIAIVKPLAAHRSDARETAPVTPADEASVDAAMAHMSLTLWRMVCLQRITGMRSGELCRMRACDIDRSGLVWLYEPDRHKNTWRGHKLVVPLGPMAQWLLAPIIEKRGTRQPLFSPRESYRETRQMLAGVTPTHNRKKPRRTPQEAARAAFTSSIYGRAVKSAIARARRSGPLEEWHPHQLRHSFTTRIGTAHGIEIARIITGHASLDATALYFARDIEQAKKIADDFG